MKKFLGFFTATVLLFAAVFFIYWEYIRQADSMVFIESFGHGVITVDSRETTGSDEKYRVVCDNGQMLTLNINPERTDSTYYNLEKLVVNGEDVTDEVNMLQYRVTAESKVNVLAYFKKGKRPSGYEAEEAAAKVERPEVERYAENEYIGSYAAYDIKDPCIFYDEKSDYYYCFGSDNVVVKSRELLNWTSRTTYFPTPEGAQSNTVMDFSAFESVEKWAKEHGYGDDLTYSDKNEDRTTLAPDIIYREGRYYLYFSLSKILDANESAIFCVSTDDLEESLQTKQWRDEGLVISSCGRHAGSEFVDDGEGEKAKHSLKASYDKANAVHPSVISTKNGLFMAYGGYYGRGSTDGEIYIVELSPKTGLLKAASAYNSQGELISTLHGSNRYQTGTLIADPGRIPALSKKDGSLVGGADIVYNSETGYYYLFVTYGTSESNYNIRVARCQSPVGPYTDYLGADMADFGASARNNQYTKGYQLVGGYNFLSSGGGGVTYTDMGRASVGSSSIVKTSKGNWFMGAQSQLYFKVGTEITTGASVAEAQGVSALAYPCLEIRQLKWTKDGWPMACPQVYSGKTSSAKIKQSSLYGNWDVIIFDNSASSEDYRAVARSTSETVTMLESAVITQSDIASSRKIRSEGILTKADGFYTVTIDSVRYSIYPSAVWDWELKEGTIVFTGIGDDGSTIWGKKNFSDALGINTNTFYYVLSMCDEATQEKYTKKLKKISSNPSQSDIDAMTSEMVDLVLAAAKK